MKDERIGFGFDERRFKFFLAARGAAQGALMCGECL